MHDRPGIGADGFSPPAADPAVAKWVPWLAVGVVVVAFALRAPRIGEWWLNPDEGIYFSVVTHESLAAFWAEAMATAHPPLYFLVLRAVGWLTTDFVWFRAVALVSGCAAAAAFVLLGREVWGAAPRAWMAGLAAGLLFAVSPRSIVLSQLIRPYMLLILLLVGSFYLFLRYLRRPTAGVLVGHALCSTVAVTLHYSAVLPIGALAALLAVDGASRGFARSHWRRMAAIQAIPIVAAGVLYLTHMRRFLQVDEADYTIDCCLGAFMAETPLDAWYGFVGFHSLLAGESLAVSASLITLLMLSYAAWARAWTPVAMLVSGFVIALAASYLRLYPFGPTRHSLWLFVLVIPAVACSLTRAFAATPRIRGAALLLVCALLAGSGPLRAALDSAERPRDISERVLRRGYVTAMGEILDPRADPGLVLMSTETYRVLIPLFWRERQAAVALGNGTYSAFEWGERDVIVIPGRDFTALPGHVGRSDHLLAALRIAEEELGPDLRERDEVLVVAAGYASQGMRDMVALAQESAGLGTTTSVPGLIALTLDPEAYAAALGVPWP